MKKVLPLLASAIALSITAGLPALSQSTTPTAPTQRNQMRRPNFLNLTAEQQARMEQIRQNERSQIDAILTTEQKAQLQRDMQNRRPPNPGENPGTPPTDQNRGTPRAGENRGTPRQPFASLNLTADQRARIEAVIRSSREQMDAVLTPQQRQQLEQHKQQHEQHHQQRQQANRQGTRTR